MTFSRGSTDSAPASIELLDSLVKQLHGGKQVIRWLIKPEGLPTRGPGSFRKPSANANAVRTRMPPHRCSPVVFVAEREGADWRMVRSGATPTRPLDPPLTSPERVPESELHFDEPALEPVPQDEAVGGLGELGHEALEIGLGVGRVSMHGW
jgi:hypothetical protein